MRSSLLAICAAGPALALLAIAGAGCGGKDAFSAPLVLGGQTVAPEVLNRGQRVYERFCATCHGADGRADTPAARNLEPRPRDFAVADFKYSAAGKLPTDQEIAHTVRAGVPGTGMPAWPNLSADELEAVIQYIKTFSPRWQAGHDGAKAIGQTVLPVARGAASFRPRQPRHSGNAVFSRGATSALAESAQPIALGER